MKYLREIWDFRKCTMKYFGHTPVLFRYVLYTALILACLFLAQNYVHHYAWSGLRETEPFNWWRQAPVPFLNYLFWALLTPLIYTYTVRFPIRKAALASTAARTIFFAVIVSSLHELCTSVIYYSILTTQEEWMWSAEYIQWGLRALPPGILTRFLEFWVLFGVLKALWFYKKFHDKQLELISLENELNAAQLIALKKQLQPHFLFNTLNTVSALMDESVDQARTVLNKLAALLRTILERDQKNKITLRGEMEYVRSYLDIEHTRFSDRLQVEYDVPENTLEAFVPSLILQPLIENAIQHGIANLTSDGLIVVRAELQGEDLLLEVQDNGPGITDPHKVMNAPGLGIRNVKDRLQLMYPGKERFQLLDQPLPNGQATGNVTIARIVIPFETLATS